MGQLPNSVIRSELQIVWQAAKICFMQSLYQYDLARVPRFERP